MEKYEKNWSVHFEFVILLVTLLGGFYTLDAKIERQICSLDSKIEREGTRTDRLYEMFYDLIKETKGK